MDTVTISRAEYEALLAAREDLADIQAYDRAVSEAGEGLPARYMDRLLDGDAPLAVFRDWRGLSQSALARTSGVNRVQIADIEAGRKTGSVATLAKLADALSVTVDDLI
ncbi:MAG: helix-turn-helix transcriptional regulator [Paracoccaceae bacterium]|nr:helix-turn-helix transcriptional regulator [Paracoccaceae bacterium]